MTKLMDPSCRLALAAMLHDLGKFAERAGIFGEGTEVDANVQLYCPKREEGGRIWHTHKHAANTGMAIDRIEPWLPRINGADVSPFAAWGAKDADDSLINAASAHHVPRSALQWIVAISDRISAGFERTKFDEYNMAPDEEGEGKLNYVSTRQHTIFESIDRALDEQTRAARWRYRLAPLSAENLFPVPAADYERPGRVHARQEYADLWAEFERGLDKIPLSHRASLPLWLDHFDTLYGCHAHAIPSATAFGTVPDVSLYDHSRAVAALAVAIWRYHHERGDADDAVATALRTGSDDAAPKILLVQGDLFGIQQFIFAPGASTQRRAAKLLRGRSFFVSLLTECAALSILDALSLPPTSQVINAAGKFRIVAPNTERTRTQLEQIRRKISDWFLKYTFGEAGLGLVWTEASQDDFRQGSATSSPYQALMRRLFDQLEEAKLQRFDLCASSATSAAFEDYLGLVGEHGVCVVDGKSPAHPDCRIGEDEAVSELAFDQIELGQRLVRGGRLLISRQPLGKITLRVPLFGWFVSLTGSEEDTGRFGPEVASGNLVRAWDFDLPENPQQRLWAGYARRSVNGYIPRWTELPSKVETAKYPEGLLEEEPPELGQPKTLNYLACSARSLDEHGRPVGVEAIGTLKGDVDNLGTIFVDGLRNPSFAREAGLSRQLNAFFATYLPALCASTPEFQDTYTVFAGGDDFFLIGPWRYQIDLAHRMRADFSRYVADNSRISFSAGISITKPGLPIRQLAAAAESAMEEAKARTLGDLTVKDGVSVFGRVLSWTALGELLVAVQQLDRWREELNLSTGYVYDLLRFVEMAEYPARLDNALWRSQFYYRTWRGLERNRKLSDDQRRQVMEQLARSLVDGGIKRYGGDFRVSLFTHLYQQRD
jgi:CRISPR-associated protein Csm1